MKLAIILSEREPYSKQGGAFSAKSFQLTSRFKRFTKVTVYSKATKEEIFRVPGVKHISISLGKYLKKFQKEGFGYFLEVCFRILLSSDNIFLIFNRPHYVSFIRKIKPNSKIYLYMGNDHIVFQKETIIRKMLNDSTKVGCVSNYIGGEIVKKYPEYAHKVETLYHGVNITKFSPGVFSEKKDLTILFVGRLSYDKGVHVLLEAFRRLCDNYPNILLKIVGSSWFGSNAQTDYTKQLQDLAKGLEDRIIFTGFVLNDRMGDVYRTADIFIGPSIFQEPSGNMNLEAMASGIPVISTKVGGIPELVGEAGLLISSENVDELYDALKKLLDNSHLRKELSVKGRERTEKVFDWDKVIHNWENALIGGY